MTLLAVLIPPEPINLPVPGEWIDPDFLPTVDDPLVMAMRPDGERYRFLRVGPTRQYTTVAAALNRATLLHAALAAIGVAITRDHRIDIVIDPGIYPEPTVNGRIATGPHMALYAADGQPRSVVIHAGIDPASGWAYYEGLVLDARTIPTSSAKYGAHQAGNGTTIFARSHLYYTPNALGSGWPMGMDGYGFGTTLMYDCRFTGSASGSRTNNHAAGPSFADPETMIYVNCVNTNGGLEFNPMGSSGNHRLWGVNNTAEWVGINNGANSLFCGSGNTMTNTSNWPTYRKTPDVVSSDWPIPWGGVSDYWRTELGLPPYSP